MLLRIIVLRRIEIICKGLAVQAMAFGAAGALACRSHGGAEQDAAKSCGRFRTGPTGRRESCWGMQTPGSTRGYFHCLPPGGKAAN